MDKEYKYPQKNSCYKCCWFHKNCTHYPKDDWPMIWLTNQCDGFKPKAKAG